MITIGKNTFTIENKFLLRKMEFVQGAGLKTISFFNKETKREYNDKGACGCEFYLRANGNIVQGYQEPVVNDVDGNVVKREFDLELIKSDDIKKSNGNELLKIKLLVTELQFEITCCYEIYSGQPYIAKWIEVSGGKEEIKLTKTFFDLYNAYPGDLSDIDFYSTKDTGAKPKYFITDISEDVIQAHNNILDEGLFACNDAPGPLKRFFIYPCWAGTSISIGYNPDTVPFTKYIKPNETFATHKAYTCFYKGKQNSPEVRNRLRDCIRQTLTPWIDDKFMYCTWIPFLKDINNKLINELATECAELGFTTFVLDDGWFVDGEWKVDSDKFPNGLEEVSKTVRDAGMKFGLWFNIGTNYGNKAANTNHTTEDLFGNDKEPFGKNGKIKCMASKHREIMVKKLVQLAKDYNVSYFKLDFSNIISPYGILPVGCGSAKHEFHKDATDAVIEQYAGMMYLKTEVQKQIPNLIIDFSFECFGTDRPNIAALQYSEVHHITNMNTERGEHPLCGRDIRNALYRHCNVLPNERILGSLSCVQGENAVENMLTAFIGAPLMAGDVRTLTESQKSEVKAIFSEIGKMIDNNPFTEFEALRGDMQINRKDWDGFIRYHKEGDGIMCLFRNESEEELISASIQSLPKSKTYTLTNILNGENRGTYSSEEISNGIEYTWEEENNFSIIKIEPTK